VLSVVPQAPCVGLKGLKGERSDAATARLPLIAQTKPDRTRREQPSEIGRPEAAKKSPEIR
jgi:hypothetical protein